MSTILITGANGQLGNEIKAISEKYNFDFIFTDVEELNITKLPSLENFFSKNSIQYIINCAAYTAVDKAESEPGLAKLINIDAVKNLRAIAEKHNSYIVHISTDYVFDGNNYKPYLEEDNVNPQSVYGRTKLAGEKELDGFEKGLIIRTSWLYSSFGHNFVKTMLRLGKERGELNVVFDQVGTPTYAADLADVILKIVKQTENNSDNFISGIYHYSNEGVISWYDFAKEIFSIKEINCKVSPIETKDYPLPTKRPFYSVLNKAKIKSTYKIDIPYWKESLIKCLKIIDYEK